MYSFIQVPLESLSKIAINIYKYGNDEIRKKILMAEDILSARGYIIKDDIVYVRITVTEYKFFKEQYDTVI